MHDSTVRDNNLVYNPEEGINNVWRSPDNEIYNNTICNVSIAFYLSNPSLAISELLQQTKQSVCKNAMWKVPSLEWHLSTQRTTYFPTILL
jgi:hypothetical protein